MLFLFIYGNNVERRLGAVWFVVWYVLTGAAATMFHAVFFSSSDVPLVGASGAISGVLGFYFIWFPKNVVRVLVILPPFFARTFQIAARIVLAVYLSSTTWCRSYSLAGAGWRTGPTSEVFSPVRRLRS